MKALELGFVLTGTHTELNHSLKVAAIGGTGLILARQRERAVPVGEVKTDIQKVAGGFEKKLKARLLHLAELGHAGVEDESQEGDECAVSL